MHIEVCFHPSSSTILYFFNKHQSSAEWVRESFYTLRVDLRMIWENALVNCHRFNERVVGYFFNRTSFLWYPISNNNDTEIFPQLSENIQQNMMTTIKSRAAKKKRNLNPRFGGEKYMQRDDRWEEGSEWVEMKSFGFVIRYDTEKISNHQSAIQSRIIFRRSWIK